MLGIVGGVVGGLCSHIVLHGLPYLWGLVYGWWGGLIVCAIARLVGSGGGYKNLFGIYDRYIWFFGERRRRDRDAKIDLSVVEIDVDLEIKSVVTPVGESLI